MKVLLVDDAPMNLELLKALCRAMRVEAEIATDGREAVEVANQQEFELVIMDIHMPRMDGIEATRLIKENLRSQGRSTKVVGLTADNDPDLHQKGLEAGMSRVIIKPIDVPTFSKLIAERDRGA